MDVSWKKKPQLVESLEFWVFIHVEISVAFEVCGPHVSYGKMGPGGLKPFQIGGPFIKQPHIYNYIYPPYIHLLFKKIHMYIYIYNGSNSGYSFGISSFKGAPCAQRLPPKSSDLELDFPPNVSQACQLMDWDPPRWCSKHDLNHWDTNYIELEIVIFKSYVVVWNNNLNMKLINKQHI